MYDSNVHLDLTKRQAQALADRVGFWANLGAYLSLEHDGHVVFLTEAEMKDVETRLRDALGENER